MLSHALASVATSLTFTVKGPRMTRIRAIVPNRPGRTYRRVSAVIFLVVAVPGRARSFTIFARTSHFGNPGSHNSGARPTEFEKVLSRFGILFQISIGCTVPATNNRPERIRPSSLENPLHVG